MRARLRRLRFGLSTLLGGAPRGFFIPYRYAATVTPTGHPALEPLFTAAQPAFTRVLGDIEGLSGTVAAIRSGEGPARFDQDWFPRLDALAACAVIGAARPSEIIEIGSGHSTRFLARAVADARLATRIVCIDPAPRASLGALPVEHVARVYGPQDEDRVAALRPGDVLFVDSSHIAMPGTDVERIVLGALPRLSPGVLVHIHDIVLPDAYPAAWAWRGYNEQIVVGALIQGGAYEIVWSSRWVATRMTPALGPVARSVPLPEGAFETSLWLRKKGAAV